MMTNGCVQNINGKLENKKHLFATWLTDLVYVCMDGCHLYGVFCAHFFCCCHSISCFVYHQHFFGIYIDIFWCLYSLSSSLK